MPESYNFIVGTFNTPHLYTLSFTAPSTLSIIAKHPAVGSHSWLYLNESKTTLYATAWTEPPSVAAYSILDPSGKSIKQISLAHTATRSGYVTATSNALFSAGGPSGEVFALDPSTGAIINPPVATNGHAEPNGTTKPSTDHIPPVQTLSFLDGGAQNSANGILDFGGLRHGAHSADLSPDHRALYVADIGRNCIWTYSVSPHDGSLTLGEKHVSPRPDDGPRHVWPHPQGKYVYCLQEHTSMVDVFSTSEDGTKLKHEQGVHIIPDDKSPKAFWADEVRTSFSHGDTPRFLYASTRGLEARTKGYLAVFALTPDGRIDEAVGTRGLLDMWQTPTSGGWANAVQPGPTVDGIEYLALTDSEEGLVMVVGWDGKTLSECVRVGLEGGVDGKVEGAATAVWL
jgi:carboxy-cis,cis-muconate cyclase